MPYSRSSDKIIEQVSKVLDKPEIAAEIEKESIRRNVVIQDVLEQAESIWESMATRMESYDLTEQTIRTRRERHIPPEAPRSLSWVDRVALGTFVMLVLSLFSLAKSLFPAKRWIAWWYTPSHFSGAHTTGFVAASLLLLFALLRIWHFRLWRALQGRIKDAEDYLSSSLQPLKDELEAAKKLADESLSQSVASQVLAVLAARASHLFRTDLPDRGFEGLSQIQNPEFEIVTAAGERLRRIIGSVNGASIGISGSRGAGKTTLLLSQYQIGNTKPNVLSVFTSAPVEYDSREFVLHLFASVCSRILEKAVGREDALERQMELKRLEEERRRPQSLLARVARRPGRLYFYVGALLTYAAIALAFFNTTAVQRAQQPGAKTAVPFFNAFVASIGLNPGAILGFGVAMMVVAGIAGPYVQVWREREGRSGDRSRPDQSDAEYESQLRQKGPHVLAAHHQLANIRFQQSFTSGWSGSLKLPVSLEATMKSDRSWQERPRTLPDLVDDYRRFLEGVVGSDRNPYDQVLICIDELDKLASDEAAHRFLNGIKSVFNQRKCYYLLSVSENAMSSFERRGLPIRDAFDSSFDEVIYVDYQPLSSSKRLLSRRVLNLPEPFACLAHVLSGGLPRDLLRICRAMFDARAQGVSNNIGEICRHVLSVDLQTKLRAIVVAAEGDLGVPRSFLNRIQSSHAGTVDQMWQLIAELKEYQTASSTPRPLSDRDEGTNGVSSLPLESLIVSFFLVTVLEIFASFDEGSWRHAEASLAFDRLATVRRSLSRDPKMIADSIDAIRQEFGLSSAEIRLSKIEVANQTTV